MGKLSTVGKTLGSAAGARPSPSLTQTPTKYPLECGLLTLYLRKILLQMLHKNQVCIVECLIHRLSRKWRNINKNLHSPLQQFPVTCGVVREAVVVHDGPGRGLHHAAVPPHLPHQHRHHGQHRTLLCQH